MKPKKVTDELIEEFVQFQRAINRGETPPMPSMYEEDAETKARPIKIFHKEIPRLQVPICVTCKVTMLPRNPMAPHLHMSEATFKWTCGRGTVP